MATGSGSGVEVAVPAADLEAAYRLCEELARTHYENFPVVSRLMPRESRRALAAIYAFAREADDYADEGYGPKAPPLRERLNALDQWERRLRDCFTRDRRHRDPASERDIGGRREDAVFTALTDTIVRYDLPAAPFLDLLSAFRQDVLVSTYENRKDLLDYCRRSANPVGRIVLAVNGVSGGRVERMSDAICTGLQLANFWQDVAVDRAKGRIYLPREDRRSFGVDETDLDEPHASAALRELILEEVLWTRGLFDEGLSLMEHVPWRVGFYLRLVWHGGTRILSKIQSADGDVLGKRPKLGKRDWLSILVRAAASAMLGSSRRLVRGPQIRRSPSTSRSESTNRSQ